MALLIFPFWRRKTHHYPHRHQFRLRRQADAASGRRYRHLHRHHGFRYWLQGTSLPSHVAARPPPWGREISWRTERVYVSNRNHFARTQVRGFEERSPTSDVVPRRVQQLRIRRALDDTQSELQSDPSSVRPNRQVAPTAHGIPAHLLWRRVWGYVELTYHRGQICSVRTQSTGN